jgi:hypothetical protein
VGFGGWWLVYVARPIFIALLAVWLWRLILLFLLLKRIAALDLAIVPTHPDRSGGLGFTENCLSPSACSPLRYRPCWRRVWRTMWSITGSMSNP